MQKEIWKDVPNYKGCYQVSNLGNVKSLKRAGKELYMKFATDVRGYYYVGLRLNNKCKIYKVHQLVAMAFLNHTPCGHKVVIDHIDSDKNNNNLNNLRLVSNRFNCTKEQRGVSKYTGVSWDKSRDKWCSKIKINGKTKNLGRFMSELEASEAYQDALKRLNKK